MDDRKRYDTVRPSNVGPHDVNKDQADPKAKGPSPEKAYNNEIGEQVAGIDPQGDHKRAQQPKRKD